MEQVTEHCQLEICVDSVESALAADRGGADRIELCGNLIIGGTTPDPALFRETRKVSAIPAHVMIRPRFGDFCYSESEFAVMCDDVRTFRELGAEGIVVGILRPDGTLDLERMRTIIKLAGDMKVTLHRCFDLVRDPFEALEQAVDLGVSIVLTSGQKNHAEDALDLLAQLRQKAGNRILIQAGSGVNPGNIERIYKGTGIRAYHMSGKVRRESRMQYRKEGVSMGIPSVSEYAVFETDEDKVRQARNVLDQLNG